MLHNLAHVDGWDTYSYNLHDLVATISWVGSVLLSYADPAQPFITAGEELDDLWID